MNNTLRYYDNHAISYHDTTLSLDMSKAYTRFLPYVKPKGKILDLGCGSGRDTKHFQAIGYEVTAVEPSTKLRELAINFLDHEVLNLTFQTINFFNHFDAIWCCASLLHVPQNELESVLRRLYMALADGGVLYISVKEGQGQHIIDGRFFQYYSQQGLVEQVTKNEEFTLLEVWLNEDQRSNQQSTKWLNAIFRKDWS
ncbi:tellurite resistance protein-related protein [Pseudoalteromonas luteoviolacea B = ATCC 29581]|nr:tellurite resistance protein-related protein [Pseudoalteromonas luteoviolacea B = ATCC 29581]